MQALLSFENAPPFGAPLRFFVAAPGFAMLAGLLLLLDGGDLFILRWSPATLAAFHLLSVGFMLHIMLGALIQVLPVVAGANLARPLRLGAVVQPGLSAGTLALAAGFYFSRPGLLTMAALLLAASVLVFLFACARALRGVPSTSPTIRGLKLALLGLCVAVGLGALLALSMAQGWALPLPELTDLHAAWGLAGWAGVLLAALAYVVVPMFQLTPGYPARPGWWFPRLIVALLLAWSLAVLLSLPLLARLAQGGLALAGLAFAGLTLRLQRKRRRARADATYRYWQFGLATSILALGMLLTAAVCPDLAAAPGWPLFFGILLVAGGFVSFIVGMLDKIVPFLAWLHLQNLGQAKVPAPNMNRILSDLVMQRQMWAWQLAVALLLGAVLFPDWLARPAGAAILLANGGLAFNLLAALRRYRRHAAEIREKLVA